MKELVPLQNPNPTDLFKPGGLDELLNRIEREARSITPDISTAKGRSEVAHVASQVARSKTYLDKVGKEYVAKLKAESNAVDAERRAMRERLDALKEEVRRPLTEFEEAEKARIRDHEQQIAIYGDLANDRGLYQSSAELTELLARIEEHGASRDWQEFAEQAEQARGAAAYTVAKARDELRAREEAAAKAEAEQRAKAEAERKEREERIAREARLEAERRAKEEAEEQERRRREAEAKAEAERQEAQRKAAEEAARKQREFEEAERRAKEAELSRIRAEQRAKAEAEAAVRAERERIEAERRQEKEDAERRAKDREHKAAIHNEAISDLVAIGCFGSVARKMIDAVAKGSVRHVTISY